MTEGRPGTPTGRPEDQPQGQPAVAVDKSPIAAADERPTNFADDQPPQPPTEPDEDDIAGPPGSRTFSLEGRPAPGLYLVAWLLSGAGIATIFIGSLTQPPVAGLMALGGLLLVGLGLAAAAGYQVLARAHRPATAYRGPSPAIVFGVLFIVTNAVGLALAAVGFGDLRTGGGFVLGAGVLFMGYLIAVWVLAVRTGALSWRDMGLLRGRGLGRIVADAGYGVVVMLPMTFVALILGGIVAQLVDARPPSVVPTPQGGLETVAVAIAAAIAIPIGEEVFFRGFALTAWLRDLGPRSALVRSSLFFAVVHIANITAGFDEGARQALVQMAVILPLGFVLGWLFLQRGLVAPIAAHITYNGTVLLLMALARQLVPLPPG